MPTPFETLCLSSYPIMLAPLAGVSDHPFRRICSRFGAELTYVEMLSATAITYRNKKTFTMMKRHESESILGVQLTGPDPDTVARAIELISDQPFDTVDLNMGCPVRKVVQQGCGSALLKDPELIRELVHRAVSVCQKPLSVKIRLGWDRNSINADEVAHAIADGGASWMTIHGRTRSDDYGVPVDLDQMAQVVARCPIPVIGNGNIFEQDDAVLMRNVTKVSGLMVSRGALGDPWVFRRLRGNHEPVGVEEWRSVVLDHLRWQREAYGDSAAGAVCMRKHVLWYAKGWPGARRLRESLQLLDSLAAVYDLINSFCDQLLKNGVQTRAETSDESLSNSRFQWDPKWDMHRHLDRGLGSVDRDQMT